MVMRQLVCGTPGVRMFTGCQTLLQIKKLDHESAKMAKHRLVT